MYYTFWQVKHKMMWACDVLDEYNTTKAHMYFDSYEEALEQGIIKACELLKKQKR